MHELSIANNIIEIVTAAAVDAGAARVETVHVRVGALTGVVPNALHFCFDLAAEGTVAAGARLAIEEAPVVIHCAGCGDDLALESPHLFVCPRCSAPVATLVSGRELLVTSIDVAERDIEPQTGLAREPHEEHAHVDAYT